VPFSPFTSLKLSDWPLTVSGSMKSGAVVPNGKRFDSVKAIKLVFVNIQKVGKFSHYIGIWWSGSQVNECKRSPLGQYYVIKLNSYDG
jgi:hypothetical protein